MKTLTEQISWYSEFENRKWKRIFHCIELSVISVLSLIIPAVMYIYGDGTNLQPILVFFSLILAISSAPLVLPLYQNQAFKRWHVLFITTGFGCGVGVSALTGFLILNLQKLS